MKWASQNRSSYMTFRTSIQKLSIVYVDIFMWIYDARETMLISFEIHLIYRIELIKCVNLANSMDENVKRSN